MSVSATVENRTERLPLPMVIVALVAATINLPGPNGLLVLFCVMVLLAGAALLWRPGEPPIFLFIFGYQWLQASVSAFHSNWLDIDVSAYSPYGGENKRAIVLTLVGLLALAAGMRAGAGPPTAQASESARRVALSLPVERWFWLYCQSSIIAFAALFVAALAPGLSQPLLALAALKWAFFLMFAYASFVRGAAGNLLFAATFLFELIASLGGFFSDFKTVMYFTMFAMVMAGLRLRLRAAVSAALLAVLIIVSGIVWTAVKDPYRQFASGGADSQAVLVDVGSRLSMLAMLTGNLDQLALETAADNLVRRISYVELLGVVLVRVPDLMPYENGANLLDAVSRPFMPRVVFSEKSEIDDTLRTSLYTGGISGAYRGTSISLGYITDLYIDFGQYLIMPVIGLLGYLYGRIYKGLVGARRSSALVGYAIASAILVQAALLEVSLPKLIGGVAVSVLIAALFMTFVAPRWVPWLADPAA